MEAVQIKEVRPSILKVESVNGVRPEACFDCRTFWTNHKCKDGKLRCWDCLEKYQPKNCIPPKFVDIQTNSKEFDKYKDNPTSLFIWGNAGTGKTVFACSLAKEYLSQFIKVKFVSYPKFIMELQNSFKLDTGEGAYDLARKVAGFKGLLILDDIGAERLTPFVQQISYFLINEREQYLLKTIITSNFSLQQIAEQIDSRIASRITGMCDILQFSGKDLRLKS